MRDLPMGSAMLGHLPGLFPSSLGLRRGVRGWLDTGLLRLRSPGGGHSLPNAISPHCKKLLLNPKPSRLRRSFLMPLRGSEEHQARQARLELLNPSLAFEVALTSQRFVLEVLGLQGSPKVSLESFERVPSVRPKGHKVTRKGACCFLSSLASSVHALTLAHKVGNHQH